MKPHFRYDPAEAVRHLRASDEALAGVIDRVGLFAMEPRPIKSLFEALLKSIVYQQLAGAAASAILGRVEGLFPKGRMTPKNLLAMEDGPLRGAGLSQNKLLALRDLAAKCVDGTVPDKRALARMEDEEIITRISQVRGIGRWTVEMMLLFRLGRPNVLPVDDYGVRKGMQRLYKLRELPKKGAMRRRARKWEPWCSVASWYMWRCAELPGVKPGKAKTPAKAKAAGLKKKTAVIKKKVAAKRAAK